MSIKQFISIKAFIVHQNKVLIIREADEYEDGYNAGTYEIPGGRIEPNENFKTGLLREIKEETGLTSISIGKPFFVDEYHPIVKNKEWQVIAVYFKCSTNTNKVTLSKDHDNYEWININKYKDYPLKSTSKKVFIEFIKNVE